MIDFKPAIRSALLKAKVNISKADRERIVEQFDILLDSTIPNSIFNRIANIVLSDVQSWIQKIRDKIV